MLSGCNLWLDTGIASDEESNQRLLSSNCVLLLVTRNSIVSRHVERDLTLARKSKKHVYTVYLDDFGFPLCTQDAYRLAECTKGDFKDSIFRLRDKIVKGLPIEVFNHIEEPFYISELNRFYSECEYYSLPSSSKYNGQDQMRFGVCIVDDKGKRLTLWKYTPQDEYSLSARLSYIATFDDPYFSHTGSKTIVATVVFSFIGRDKMIAPDHDIVLTIGISELDAKKPKITLINCQPLFNAENEKATKNLIKHIEKSFK